MADDAYWFGGPRGEKVAMYAPPGIVVPLQLDLVHVERGPISFRLLSAPLWCEGCKSRDCHTRRLGECQCGAHQPDGNRAAVVLQVAPPDPSRPPTASAQPTRPRFDTR